MAIAVFRLAVSPRLSQALEFAVGVMLVFLGLNVIRKLLRGDKVHVHSHTRRHDAQPPAFSPLQRRAWTRASRLARGRAAVCGGSGARPGGYCGYHADGGGAIPSLLLACGYIVIFGIGSIGGMMLMSTLMSVPLALAARESGRARHSSCGGTVQCGLRGLPGLGGGSSSDPAGVAGRLRERSIESPRFQAPIP